MARLKSDFFYELPEELIAQVPLKNRDASRLLIYRARDGFTVDGQFLDIIDYLKKGDVLVINNTRVIPARIFGKKQSGARVEFLLHKRKGLYEWEALAKPAKRAKEGDEFIFSDELEGIISGEGEEGIRNICFSFNGIFEDILDRIGSMPLPSYIHKNCDDKTRYQTVYAKTDGSCAAPTAGLHFTEDLIKKLKDKGVIFAEVLLHVGLGTFRPVKTDNISDHKMHSEYYEISPESAKIINDAKADARRVIAVGTTSVRTLESCANQDGTVSFGCGETNIFIYPPYRFKVVDGLITNFHLPESTLIMLVSAFIGREKTLELYRRAVDNKYRFFSFGDACLFL